MKNVCYSSHNIALSKGTIFTKKNANSLQINVDIRKI